MLETKGKKIQKEAKPKSKKKLKKAVVHLLTKCFIVLLVGYLILQYVLGFYYLRGNYMFPAMRDGDFLITYKLEEAVLNDVVVYNVREKGKLVKRVGRLIAKSGDIVSFNEDGELLVNGYAPSEEIFYASLPDSKSDIKYPYTVPDGEVFILNDYRSGASDSYKDSRDYSSIRVSDLKGKVLLLIRRRGF